MGVLNKAELVAGGLFAAMIDKGVSPVQQRLKRAAAARRPTSVLGTNPLTVGSVGANSTIQPGATYNTPTVAITDPRIEVVGSLLALQGSGVGYRLFHISVDPGPVVAGSVFGAGVRVAFDGQAIDFGVNPLSAATLRSNILFRVTDLDTGARAWHASSEVALPTGKQHLKLDFGSRGRRMIELFLGDAIAINGINIANSDTIWAVSAADQPKLAVFGDSWVSDNPAQYNTSIRGGLAYQIADQLGIDTPYVNGLAGTGWLRSTATQWGRRIAAGDLSPARVGVLDVIVFPFVSINDAGFTDAEIVAAMLDTTSGIPAVAAQQPNALIFVGGPQLTTLVQTPQSRYDAIKAGLAGLSNPNIIYLDNSPSSVDRWLIGAGNAGSTTCTGSISGTTLTITTGPSNGTFYRPGMTVSGANVTAGTKIVDGPAAGTGAFTVDRASTAASTTLTITGQTGTGNNDVLLGADGNHLADIPARQQVGYRIANAIRRALQ